MSTTITKVYVLKCDAKDCGEVWCGDMDETIDNVRSEAAREDWWSDGRQDLCPDHVPL